jgi:glycosyltransferase involved in cell wall biosynthesis
MVATNPDFNIKDSGTTVSRNKLISLLSCNNDVILFNAHRGFKSSHSSNISQNIHRIHYFNQWFIFGKCLKMFTDLNISFLLKIKKIVKRENIDIVCITEPYGIIATSLGCPYIPVVYDAHDIAAEHAKIDFQRLKMDFRMVKLPVINKIIKTILLNYIYFIERLACKKAKHIIAITALDKHRFIQKYHLHESKITAIPVWVALDDSKEALLRSEKLAEKKSKVNIIFHGIYRHPANYAAFKLIEDYIAPEVKKYNKDIQFLLAGTDVPQFEKENVKSLGHVKDLLNLLEICDIAIVPILQGTGVRIKILDYMAAGLPIITTKKGIEGIEAEDGTHAIILDTVDKRFIDAILNLAIDMERRRTLAENAFALARIKHGRESVQDEVNEMLAKIMRSKEK